MAQGRVKLDFYGPATTLNARKYDYIDDVLASRGALAGERALSKWPEWWA